MTRRSVILIVEDDILCRVSAAEHLRSVGYEVAEAADAGEAITILDSGENVDAVFTDVQMPGAMDGLMLAHWVYEHHPGTKVLVTSGKGDAAVSSSWRCLLFETILSCGGGESYPLGATGSLKAATGDRLHLADGQFGFGFPSGRGS